MGFGFNGKILKVNLSSGKIRYDEPAEAFYRTYLGGSGLVGYYLLRETKAGIDPLSPDSLLVFAAGIVTGAPSGGTGRHTVGGKSPLTGGFAAAESGGFWGAELKHAGFDAIVITGRSERPVYLWLHDGEAEILDAGHLWGKTTADCQETIRKDLGDKKIRVAQIGPGGENQVMYACVMNDLINSAGRGGLGALMGSKQLKAIAVRGRTGPEMANPEAVKEVAKYFGKRWQESGWGRRLRDSGTATGVLGYNTIGNLPTYNFKEGSFEGAEKISGEIMRDNLLVGRETCYACPIRCKRVIQADEPYNLGKQYGGPEYETIGSFGSLCGVDDIYAISHANQLCNAYTIDTISTGVSIAFAMECYENGLFTKEDTGGLELRFGNAEAMIEMVHKIAYRDGIGDLLAQGVKRAAEAIGHNADRYAMHVKGMELPMHDPRVKQGMGLGYAVSSIGADHMQGLHDTSYPTEGPTEVGILETLSPYELSPAKVRWFVYLQRMWSSWNCLLLCDHCGEIYDTIKVNDLVRGVTGWNTTNWELMKAGERSLAMARAFNMREGLNVSNDWLPKRFFKPHPTTPPSDIAVSTDDLRQGVDIYYEMAGWDKNGVPTPAKLVELGVEWVIDQLPQK